MKIYFPFPDKKITYDCKSCEATCCHVNNFLLLNDVQKDKVLNKEPMLKNFIRQNNNMNYLYSGKKCWFLEDGICNLHKEYGSNYKPISCQIYPIKFRKINEKLIIGEYVPCPNFEVKDNEGISHEEYKNKFIDNIKFIDLISQNYNVSKERLKQEEDFRDEFNKEFSTYFNLLKEIDGWELLDSNQKTMAKKIFWLYPQIRMQNELLQLPFQWSLNSIHIYAALVCKITVNFRNNIQNIYTLVLSEFINTIKRNDHIIIH